LHHGKAGGAAASRGAGLELAQMDLTALTPYAIQIRYDFEFWTDSETASDALHLALKVRQAIMAALPSEARP